MTIDKDFPSAVVRACWPECAQKRDNLLKEIFILEAKLKIAVMELERIAYSTSDYGILAKEALSKINESEKR